jgi:hypothetical protein
MTNGTDLQAVRRAAIEARIANLRRALAAADDLEIASAAFVANVRSVAGNAAESEYATQIEATDAARIAASRTRANEQLQAAQAELDRLLGGGTKF